MSPVILGDTTPLPPPGWSFRIAEVHLAHERTPWFTGAWHRTGTQPADDPTCALWLTITAENPGFVTIALDADDPARHGRFHALARHHSVQADAWTQVIAPAVAAHPWSRRIHYRRPSKTPDRVARAILAHLIVHR
ncbi:hypothetical protein ABH935_007034 [Catenulispora sp. GAS73]|uniref:hypothetical protein n=1 Tax=Catenulispora sp. GAS73 TaxID=3156269 RepID=UPI003518504D